MKACGSRQKRLLNSPKTLCFCGDSHFAVLLFKDVAGVFSRPGRESQALRELKIKTRRQKQVENLLKQDIDEIIRRDVSDTRIGFFTVTYVNVSKDLKHSTVGISVIGSKQEQEKSFNAIQNACGYIHHKLAKKSLLKYTPDIKFKYDDMPELRVEEILTEIKKKEENGRD